MFISYLGIKKKKDFFFSAHTAHTKYKEIENQNGGLSSSHTGICSRAKIDTYSEQPQNGEYEYL